MSFYNQGYGGYGYGQNWGQQMSCNPYQQEWLLVQIPGLMVPFYIHAPTMYVYEQPIITSSPLGIYSYQSGMISMNSNFFNSSLGAEYRSMPVQTPYSAAALAVQGGKYPATSMSVSNEVVYPLNYYPTSAALAAMEYQRPFALGYGSGSSYGGGYYGQRGLLPAPMTAV